MANVAYAPLDFHVGPIKNKALPFGFGFGLSGPSSSSFPSSSQNHSFQSTAALQQLAPIMHSNANVQQMPLRSQKRRLEQDEDIENVPRDHSMDRSPTPERPKRAQPKRARVITTSDSSPKHEKVKESKEDDIDIGVLLATLPPQSLLPILTSLLKENPALKSPILQLIPRPTLEVALSALAQAAKKLRDAYPYSLSVSSPASAPMSVSLGAGFGNGNSGSGFGFGNSTTTPHLNSNSPNPQNGGMRDSYILSRIQPFVTEFITACTTYLPYFSPAPISINPNQPANNPTSVIRALDKSQLHPSETYTFLAALTSHFLSQPSLSQSALAPLLLPRLRTEWNAWVDWLDNEVNQKFGMFGSEVVNGWARGLDEFAESRSEQGSRTMREVRNSWTKKVGWLVGRQAQFNMDDEEL